MMSVHTISDSMPSATSGVAAAGPVERGLEGVERAGADIAIDDAECPDRHLAQRAVVRARFGGHRLVTW